jgi:LAS superfamily LD-carboxypeptidase LdcB
MKRAVKKRIVVAAVVVAGVIVMGGGAATGVLALRKTSPAAMATVSGKITKPAAKPVAKPAPKAEAAKPAPAPTATDSTVEPYYKDGVLVVNKKHPLPASYAPGENPTAVANLRALISDGQSVGVDLIESWSGYRSYSTQVSLYNSYVARDGRAAADTYSARPGYSEHQSGLAFDLKDHTGNLYRASDASYNPAIDWVYENCARFGFIVRYRADWEGVTGYEAEPWHLRYVGADLAAKVMASGEPLETYLGVTGGDYE